MGSLFEMTPDDVLETLTRHMRTPDDCYFCLWDGWGSDIEGDAGVRTLDPQRAIVRQGPQIAPAFPPSVLHGPKLVVPNRAYFLFRGSVSEFGGWGAAERWPGQPRLHMPDPAFIWPADHAWCVANDVDPHWAGSEPTSRPSTSFWLIRVSTSSQPTHARTSRPTGRRRKGPEFLRNRG